MKKRILSLLLVLVCVCIFTCIALAAEETFINPVANGADPFVFKDTDGTYYLYVTSGGNYGYRVYTSANLVEWESQGYCLKPEDVYIDQNIVSRTLKSDGTYSDKVYPNFWAPEVIKDGDTYYMVYTAQEHIGIATSDSPLGPFKNDATSYLIPYEITGFEDGDTGATVSTFKCIDGHFYRDDDGTVYLYFVSNKEFAMNGSSVTKGNNIWGGPFDLETLTFANGYPKLLVKNESETGQNSYAGWENQSSTSWLTPHKYDGSAVAEGPEMLKHNGKYYLTFSQDSYSSPQYSVFYVTADSPMGPFDSNAKTLAFITDDQSQSDSANPHLYGTAHHAFTTSPDGSQLVMVYHAHRSINAVAERRVCLDIAGFDESGNFWAGTVNKGHPTATAQPLPSGGTLERKEHLTGSFANIPNLPTVYVANEDGDDSAAGTAAAPLKTITAACAKLENGGTIIITQLYQANGETSADYLDIPSVNGPLMIKGAMKATPLSFKFISINSDIYFENISFWPATLSDIAVIECNFNNVVMGDGVSCISQPTRKTFPYLVGGKWWSNNTSGVYSNFNYSKNADVTSDKEFSLTVYSGTWSMATENSVRSTLAINATAQNGTLVLAGDAKIRPAKASAPRVTATAEGAKLSFAAVEYAPEYVVYKNGEVIGYTTELTYLDTTWTSDDVSAKYSVAGYVNGACIGDASVATALKAAADEGYMTFKQYDIYRTAKPLDAVSQTYEAWIRVPEGKASGIIIGNSNSSYFHGFWIQINKNGAPVLKFYDKEPDGAKAVVNTYTFSKSTVNSGEWNHIAITTDVQSKTVSCYINGELSETQEFTYNPPLSPMPLVLGGDNLAGNSTYFRGHLRSAALFSDVRTADEIKADMVSVDATDANILASYDLTNATFGDDVIEDASGKNDMLRTEYWQDYIEPVTDFAYSFAIIGDQQKVTSLHPDYVHYMYDWILQNKDIKNIKYVIAPGDVTDLRTNNDWEWEIAKTQFERLSGVIPMSIAQGNHDYADPFDQYMNFEGNTSDIVGRYAENSVLNVYKTAKIGKTDYLFLVLEYGPTDAVVEWACDVVEQYPNHKVIINTHSYLHSDGTLTDPGDLYAPTGDRNDGVDLWNKLVRKYENIILVICGHIETYETLVVKSVGDNGNVVTQMLINPQSLDMLEPTGIVTMFYFNEDGNVLTTEFYSTVRKQYYLPEVFRTTIYVGERSGDANGDGNITVADALCALSSVVGKESYKNADIDGDGKITMQDALGIMRIAVKGE